MSSPTIAISGAAAGIGRAIALRFLGAGYRVGAFDIDEVGLASLAREAGPGAQLVTAYLDVTSAPGWERVLSDFVDDRLDILVNNAGVLSGGRFAEMSVRDHQRMVDINVTGTILGSRAGYRYLLETPGAQVVNMCSASAIYGQPELATYSATKAAVKGLTEALELEWRRDGIRVLAMWPIFVDTAMTAGMDVASFRAIGNRLTVDDVAEAVYEATRPSRGLVPTVHYAVKLPARVLGALTEVSPTWVKRLGTKLVTRS